MSCLRMYRFLFLVLAFVLASFKNKISSAGNGRAFYMEHICFLGRRDNLRAIWMASQHRSSTGSSTLS